MLLEGLGMEHLLCLEGGECASLEDLSRGWRFMGRLQKPPVMEEMMLQKENLGEVQLDFR